MLGGGTRRTSASPSLKDDIIASSLELRESSVRDAIAGRHAAASSRAPARERPAEVAPRRGRQSRGGAPLRSLGLCLQLPLGARSPGRCRGRAGPGGGPAGVRSGSRGPKGPSGPPPGTHFASLPSLPRVSDPLEAPTAGRTCCSATPPPPAREKKGEWPRERAPALVRHRNRGSSGNGRNPAPFPSLADAGELLTRSLELGGRPVSRHCKGTGSGNRRACRSGGTCRRRRNQASALHIVVSMCMCSGPWRGPRRPARRRHGHVPERRRRMVEQQVLNARCRTQDRGART